MFDNFSVSKKYIYIYMYIYIYVNKCVNMFRRRCWQPQSTTFFLVSLTVGVDKWQVASPTKRWPQGSRLKDQDQTTISFVSFKLCEQVCLIHSTFYYMIDNHTLRFGSDMTVLYQTMRCCDRFVVTFGWSQSYHLCLPPKTKIEPKVRWSIGRDAMASAKL